MAIAANKMPDAGSQTDILSDIEGCLSGSKQEHIELLIDLTVQFYKLVD